MNIYEDTQMQNDNEFHANASNGNIENFDCDAFVKSTYKSINSFYGVFYDNYTTLKTMLIWRLPFLIAFLGVTFFLAPFT